LYWNLIWYYTQIQLPYEFLVPYDIIYEIALNELKKSSEHIQIKRKIRFNEQIEIKGVDNFIKEQQIKQNRGQGTPGAADQPPKERRQTDKKLVKPTD